MINLWLKVIRDQLQNNLFYEETDWKDLENPFS